MAIAMSDKLQRMLCRRGVWGRTRRGAWSWMRCGSGRGWWNDTVVDLGIGLSFAPRDFVRGMTIAMETNKSIGAIVVVVAVAPTVLDIRLLVRIGNHCQRTAPDMRTYLQRKDRSGLMVISNIPQRIFGKGMWIDTVVIILILGCHRAATWDLVAIKVEVAKPTTLSSLSRFS